MIAEYLGIADRPDLAKLLELARRDDLEGKGTLSADPIDRAFGISALLTNLNKSLSDNSQAVLNTVIPLITAHFLEENRRHELLPKEYSELTESGKLKEFNATQLGKIVKVVIVESDNPALAGYLRSRAVGAGLVVQKSSTGHVNFITNQSLRLKLNKLARIIKTLEAEKNNIVLKIDSMHDLEAPGRTENLPHWYYDTRANTLQNGGVNPKGIPPTELTAEEIEDAVKDGLNVELNQHNQHQNQRFQKNQPRFTKGKGVVYLD
jgi:hypothetical protein